MKKQNNMDYKKLNSLLANIGSLRYNLPEGVKFVGRTEVSKIDSDYPRQGENGEYYDLFNLGKDWDNQFLKVTYTTDSYGSNDSLQGFLFCKPVEKQVTVYEFPE